MFVEKPLATTFEDARDIVRHAVVGNRKLTVGHNYSFDPATLRLRELVEQGTLGRIVHLESYCGYDLTGPFGAALLADRSHWVHALPGGLFQNIMDHVLNRIAEFVDTDSSRICASAYRSRPAKGDSSDELLDELRVTIQGDSISAYATFCSGARPVSQFLRVYGTHNIAHVDYVGRTVTLATHANVPGALGKLWPALDGARQSAKAARHNIGRFIHSDFQFFAGFNLLLRAFYESIRSDSPPPIPYDQILRVALWMDEIANQVYPVKVEVGR